VPEGGDAQAFEPLAGRLQRSRSRVVGRLAVEAIVTQSGCGAVFAWRVAGVDMQAMGRAAQALRVHPWRQHAGMPWWSGKRQAEVSGVSIFCLSSKASSIAGVPGAQL
jgi:hypothetical protein